MKDLVAKAQGFEPPKLKKLKLSEVQDLLDMGYNQGDIATTTGATPSDVGIYIFKHKLTPLKALGLGVVHFSNFFPGKKEWNKRMPTVVTKRQSLPYIAIPIEMLPESFYDDLVKWQKEQRDERELPQCVLNLLSRSTK